LRKIEKNDIITADKCSCETLIFLCVCAKLNVANN